MDLTILIAMPLLGAAAAALAPRAQIGIVAAILSFLPVGFVIPMLFRISEVPGPQSYYDQTWISDLGIHYSLGYDGLSIFMIALTVLAWTIATIAASRRQIEQPRLFYVMMGLAQAGTLGAFLAQDLILFVLFFDLLLIPFYFLIGIWGQGDHRAATLKFVIYTLAGSLLMFASAIALGVTTAAAANTPLDFAFLNLAQTQVSDGTQNLIFIGFAIALVIKMPLPPLHGWMPDTYKAAPLSVLIPLSAVVAKLGAYGFLRVVLPLLPDATEYFQDVMLALALAGIIYGSVMAFSQDNLRLIIGYSSIAQIGFVTLGIFTLDPKGVEGAVLQMINHALVVIPLFLIVGMLRERSGSESLAAMGGLARRAPVFATMFLIVALATLAMPGSANFVGELYILFGAFDGEFVYGVIATAGVLLAAVYMIRFYQRTMHNPGGEAAKSRELNLAEFGLIAPVVLAILALGVYPQFVVKKIEPAAGLTVEYVRPSVEPLALAPEPELNEAVGGLGPRERTK